MKYLFSGILSLLFCAQVFAQDSPIKWSFEAKALEDGIYELHFQADIEGEWYLYSQFLNSEDGPIPTSFEFEKVKGIELLGKTEEISDVIQKFDDMFAMELKYFKHEAKFVQKVKITDQTKLAKGFLTFMTCNNEQCMPPTDIDFEFILK